MPRYKYDYYTIHLPGDVYDSVEELGQLAIAEADEKSRRYCLPAEWTAELVNGEVGDFEVTFKVRRKRLAAA